MGGSVKRWLAAAAASILVLGTSLLAGSCTNPLNWALQTWGTLDMVKVQGGTLTLGDVENFLAYPDESPMHSVTLSAFRLSRYEVTQQLYFAVMGTNPSYFKYENGFTYEPFRPVESVSWLDATLFCNELSRQAGLTPCYTVTDMYVTWDTSADGYRLPTEAEWEYAARGGQSSGGYWLSGSDYEEEVACYDGNSVYDDWSLSFITQTVGGKASNELDLYDMSGNVCEWVWDVYYADYYWDNPSGWQNPLGPALDEAPINQGYSFVFRGGSTNSSYEFLRNAKRLNADDWTLYPDLGFRVARNN